MKQSKQPIMSFSSFCRVALIQKILPSKLSAVSSARARVRLKKKNSTLPWKWTIFAYYMQCAAGKINEIIEISQLCGRKFIVYINFIQRYNMSVSKDENVKYIHIGSKRKKKHKKKTEQKALDSPVMNIVLLRFCQCRQQ